MEKTTCVYYQSESGRLPAKDFIDSLDVSSQRKFFFCVELLEAFGHELPFPHAKYIGDQIFELRFTAKEGAARVLYFFFHRDRTILTNGFIKKSNKIPMKEKQLAVERRKAYLARNEHGGS